MTIKQESILMPSTSQVYYDFILDQFYLPTTF